MFFTMECPSSFVSATFLRRDMHSVVKASRSPFKASCSFVAAMVFVNVSSDDREIEISPDALAFSASFHICKVFSEVELHAVKQTNRPFSTARSPIALQSSVNPLVDYLYQLKETHILPEHARLLSTFLRLMNVIH